MDRRSFLRSNFSRFALFSIGGTLIAESIGCRGRQIGHIINDSQSDMVGSHEAGAAAYNQLIEESVARLLGREEHQIQMVSHDGQMDGPTWGPGPKRICFVGVENATVEELGDFREQIYELIDSQISRSDVYQPINRRYVNTFLETQRFRPDDLFIPHNQREFIAYMEKANTPFDYLLFAKLTSGTTENNRSTQRDYLLTLELVNIHEGTQVKESAKIRKGYHKTRIGKVRNYNPFTKK